MAEAAHSTDGSGGIGPGTRLVDYEIVGPIGQGGMGRVFEAVHAVTGERVAIKTLLSRDRGHLESFEGEVATLSELRHPGIVTFRDHGVLGGQPWYAMDLLEGFTLRDALRGTASEAAEATPAHGATAAAAFRTEAVDGAARHLPAPAAAAPSLALPDLLNVCREVLRALEYVHARGVVHCDVKPENVFLRGGSRPVLVDFGIAAAFDAGRERVGLVPRSLGSVAYMAPERLRGALPDARADLYALGCILYECMTGRQPFLRASIEATKLAHLHAELVAPSRLGAPVPAAWDALVLRLLSRSPADRPGFARDVLEVLEPSRASEQPSESPASSGYLFRPPLVGRAEPLALLRSRLTALRSGAGARVLLRAGAGMGKTRLVLEVAELALRQQLAVFRIECTPKREARPRSGLDALSDLLAKLRERELESGGAAAGSRLTGVEEAVALLASGEASAERAAGARQDIVANLAAALAATAADAGALMIVEDLQHADELTREFVRRLALDEANGKHLLLLCTDGGADANEDSTFTGLFEQVPLSPLNEAEIDLAVRSMLALEYPSPRLVERAHHVSQGNPFIVGLYLHALIDAGILRRNRHQGWHAVWPPEEDERSDDAARIDTVRALFEWRIRELSPVALRLATVAALLTPSFDVPTLARVAGVSDDEVLATVRQLSAGQVLEVEGADHFRFSHPTLSQLLALRLAPDEAKRVHRRAAAWLRNPGGRPRAAASILAVHLGACGSNRKASVHFAEAAHGELRAYRRADALESLEAAVRALMKLPSSERRHGAELLGLNEELGDVAISLRQYGKAASAFERALLFARGEHVVSARIYRKLAGAEQRDRERAGRYLARAAEELEAADHADPVYYPEWIQVELDTLWRHYWRQETGPLLAIAARLARPIAEFGTERQRASLDLSLAVGLMQHHRYVTGPTELGHAERALAAYDTLGDRPNAAMSRFVRSMILLFADRLDEAEQGFEAILAVSEKATSVTIRVRALVFLCILHRKRRDRERVRRLAASAHALATEHGMLEYQGTALANLAWVAIEDGEPAECERHVQRALALWDASPLNVFRWTGLLPFLAAILARPAEPSDADQIAHIAQRLLDPTQQALAEPVRDALAGVLVTLHDVEARRSRAAVVLERARDARLM
ncbi:MAG TPA: protein kinase [Polyangiaceae bacterium]|nr:protein kinase [Polyangiaceae bacterium]